MNIQIIEKDFSMSYPMEHHKSFIWTDRYNEYGDFEIYIPITTEAQKILKIDNYVWCDMSSHLMMIEDIKTESDLDNGNFLIVTGKSLESLPARRIIWYAITFTDEPLQTVIKVLLEKNIINPDDPSRAIKNFIFEESTDERITRIDKVSLTCEVGDDLYEKIRELLTTYQIGFKVIPNDKNEFVFSLYMGVDRSYAQEENPWIIFSPNQDNIISSRFNESTADYKNVTLVLNEKTVYSEEDPTAEPTTEKKGLVLGSASGLSRRETFTDARSLDIDEEATEHDLLSQMRTEGYKTLADYKYNKDFEGEVDYIRSYQYGTDFYLGDIVEIKDLFGNEGRERVNEYMIKEDTNGFSAYPTFTSMVEDTANDPYSLELKLGIEHTNAFYGDWGYEAYQHAHTVGNPHKTTWTDVGADEAGAAEKFYEQAKGDAQAAGNQALRNANKYTDQRIRELIAQYVVDWTVDIDNAAEKALEEAKRFTEMLINELVGDAPANLDTIYELADALVNNTFDHSTVLSDAKKYTDDSIEKLVGSAPDALDTIYELADAINNNKSMMEALNTAITNKVSKTGDTMTGTLTVPQLIDNGLSPNTVVTSNGNKQLTSSSISTTKLGYLSDVTSNIQAQINAAKTSGDNAQSSANNKVSKTGDTMTGQLKNSLSGNWTDIANGRALLEGTAPTNSHAVGLIAGRSTNGKFVDWTHDLGRGIAYYTNANISAGGSARTHEITLLNESGQTILKNLTASNYTGNWNGRSFVNAVGCVPVEVSYSANSNNAGTTFNDFMTQVNTAIKNFGISPNSHCCVVKAKHWNWTGLVNSSWGIDFVYGQNNNNGFNWNDGMILHISGNQLAKLAYGYDTATKQFKITACENISSTLNDLKNSVSNGKKLVANAITAKGVQTATNAEFQTMADNVGKIKTTPNLQPKSASLSTAAQTIKPDSGYDGLSQVTVPAVTGTAAVGDVLKGKTFNSGTAGISKTGTMASYSKQTVDVASGGVNADTDNTHSLVNVPKAGYYDTQSKLRVLNSDLLGNISNYSFTTISADAGSTYTVKNDCAILYAYGWRTYGDEPARGFTCNGGTAIATTSNEVTCAWKNVPKGSIVTHTVAGNNWCMIIEFY